MENSGPSIQIDLNEFKLHLHLKNKTQRTFHFDTPSRRFYLSVIALVVNEMKKLGKIKSIPLLQHLDLLALMNESIGGTAGSSDKENLLPRIYRKWKSALPNLEEAPLFKVLGKKKEEGDGAIGKVYSFTEAEKDGWANLFEYMGSDENVRLKFAIDKIGVSLNETSIIFGDSLNGDAWDRFISSLKNDGEGKPEPVEENAVPEPAPAPFSPAKKKKFSWLVQNRWIVLVAVIGILAGALAIQKTYLNPGITVASVNRMHYPLPDKPSIAVLPFANMSEDPGQEFFSDGLTEEITTSLSKLPQIFVIARNSAFIYKGKPTRVGQVAEELGVRYIVEGSVRRVGEKVRINAQLIDAIKGHHLWAEHYDGSMKDVFGLQDQITQKIISALDVKLTGKEKEFIGHPGIDNLAAYDEFKKGWIHYLRMTPDDLPKAIQFFKRATELDPNYSRAYAALALAYAAGSFRGGMGKKLGISWYEIVFRSRQYLNQAMKNPTSIVHTVNSQFYLFRRQHEKAVSELEQAIRMDPNDPSSHAFMGNTLLYMGKTREAVDFINQAMRLDPQNPSFYLTLLGAAQFCMGNLEEAAKLLERALQLNPETSSLPTGWLASTYGLLGREQEARAALDAHLKDSDMPRSLITLVVVMLFYPFKDAVIANRFAEGLVKAGMPGPPSAYLPAFKENQLTGKEIKSLFFGSTVTGFDLTGKQWWNERKENGDLISSGPGTIAGDTGKSRIEGDSICTQFQKRLWGVECCSAVFRNPNGMRKGLDEYFNLSDYGFVSFSLVR